MSGGALGGTLLGLHIEAALAAGEEADAQRADERPFQHLSDPEAVALGAFVDQIYPPDETPGAREIGAVHFMDVAFGDFMAGALPPARQAVATLDEAAAGQGAATFAALAFDEQTQLLKGFENEGWFSMLHFMTLAGLFCLPSYGGNRNKAGWAALGFEARHVWQPPFGHYDAEYAKEHAHAVS